MEGFTNVQIIDIAEDGHFANGFRKELAVLQLDPWVRTFLTDLTNSRPPHRIVPLADLVSFDPGKLWKESAQDRVKVPIAISDSGEILYLTFGVTGDGRPCAHAICAGMTGSGKSILFHVFLLALCFLYGPEELQLYLVDGKQGVGCHYFRRLPHARVIVLQSEPEYARSLLAEVYREMERRNALFQKACVSDYQAYRKAGQPLGRLPRLIVVIDEYQQLFEGDNDGLGSKLLLLLSQQGRSAAIHLFLCSQRLGVPGMRHQAAVFASFHTRIALQMTLADRATLTEFGPEGRQLIARCDRPGRIVFNAQNGDDGANRTGQAAFVDAEECRALVEQLRQKANTELSS